MAIIAPDGANRKYYNMISVDENPVSGLVYTETCSRLLRNDFFFNGDLAAK